MNYSIIIPHKNIPELLRRCLNSIPQRNDIQIIVVDDNSDSSIVDFEHFPGIDNPMVEIIITKENKGAGYARNVGLKKAIGKWILFADADDFYNKNAFSFYDEYLNSPYDVIYFGTNSVYSDTLEPANRTEYINRNILPFLSAKEENSIRYFTYPPWCKMIRKSLVCEHAIFFDEIFAGNDIMFSAKVGHYAGKIYADKRQPYCATVRKGSLVNSINKQVIKSRLNARVSLSMFLRKIGKREIDPSYGSFLLQSMHSGAGTFLWVFKTMLINRLRFFNGYIGIRKIKKIIKHFNKKNYGNSEYKVYK